MLRKDITLDFGNFKVFENYILGTINNGVVFDAECKTAFAKLSDTYFKGRYFGYISNRVNSYSVDPTIYLDNSEEFAQLKAMAVVTNGYLQESNVNLERQFFKAEMKAFHSIEEASLWIDKKITYSKSKSLST